MENFIAVLPDRQQYRRPAACVITQRYFSAFYVLLRFQSHYEKFYSHFKNVFI
jgi:hypothetical protein